MVDYLCDVYMIIKKDFDRVVADLKWDTMHYETELGWYVTFEIYRFIKRLRVSLGSYEMSINILNSLKLVIVTNGYVAMIGLVYGLNKIKMNCWTCNYIRFTDLI